MSDGAGLCRDLLVETIGGAQVCNRMSSLGNDPTREFCLAFSFIAKKNL
jgi:hypothetical protein